jgi:hypothetical protein
MIATDAATPMIRTVRLYTLLVLAAVAALAGCTSWRRTCDARC